MRVAIVTQVLSHFEVPLYRLIAGLPDLTCQVFHTDQSAETFFDADYGTTVDWGEQLRSSYSNRGFFSVGDLEPELLEWEPDVVMLCGYAWPGALGLLLRLRRKRIPVIHRGTISHLPDPRAKGLKARIKRLLRPAVLRLFDAHLYGGRFNEIALERAGVPDSHRYFVPFSIDTGYFSAKADAPEEQAKARDIRVRHGWASDDPVLLQIGQLAWVKGADLTVDITARIQADLPKARLLVVGDGPERAGIEAAAAQRLIPGSFAFAGFVPSKETTACYLASDLVLFPSRYETWARAVNEAMLCRRPCLVTRYVAASGGLVEDGETGLVAADCAPQNIAAQAAGFLRRTPETRTGMGAAARKRALYFSYEAHLDTLHRGFFETAARQHR